MKELISDINILDDKAKQEDAVHITVEEGDKVETGAVLGVVRTNAKTKKNIIKFSIYHKDQFVNPKLWIK